NAQVDPTTSFITDINGHKLPVISTTHIGLKSDGGSFVNIPFLVSKYGSSLLGLKALRFKQFKWEQQHEDILQKNLEFLNRHASLKPFSSKDKSVLTTGASPMSIASVLQQNGPPVICISKRLKKSLDRSSDATMVQRWSIELGAYDCTTEHRSAKDILHADFLSRYSLFENSAKDTDRLLVQPLPVDRIRLINDTRKYYGCIINATKRGWNIQCKRRFPDFYKRRDEISVHPEGFLCLNYRTDISPTLRFEILDGLHSPHLEADKVKSLARLTCW
ncbi:unnamed protein product, partial [Trichobilharzia regenti]